MSARALLWVCITLVSRISADGPAVHWLVIAGTSKDPQSVITVEKRLQASWPAASIVASQDCSNLSPGLYLAVMSTTSDRSAALEEVGRLKQDVPDAYLKACIAKPGTRMAFGIAAVDPSIENVPEEAVNWTDADRVSEVLALPDSGHLWVRRTYVPDAEDPREGRRSSVLFFRNSPSEARVLEADCDQLQYAQKDDLIAITCAREVAGKNLLHTTDVFAQPNLAKLKSAEHCRDPKIISETEMNCAEEHVGPDGNLKLVIKKVRFRATTR
jgi:hypothetical protein